MVSILLGALLVSGLSLVAGWFRSPARDNTTAGRPDAIGVLIGFVTNFFDTLGIGSFATTTAAFRLLRRVRDELIPGTMIIGHSLPVIAQALIFITVVDVNPAQMAILIACCVAGGWVGAGVVASFSRRAVQFAMAIALSAAAVLMVVGMIGLIPAGGNATNFSPQAFAVAVVVSVVLGALLTIGIGNYAPSLIIFSLLGMDPRAAFPIMMGSGAFVATIAGVRFVARGRFDSRAALGLAIGGIPGVLVAAWIVRSLPLDALRWLVVAVVIYSAISLLRSAITSPPVERTRPPHRTVR
ncbi:MAG: sulfite exporter TauE/SafE family protein [Vicinamibacterales bacterium]